MAAPKKDGKVWRHRIMVDGKRTSGTFDTKAAALQWEAETRTAAKSPGLALAAKTCDDAFRKYQKEVSPKKRGKRWEELRLEVFARSSLAKVKMGELRPSHIAAWRDERLQAVQPATVNREMNLLSNVFAIARKEWHWLDASPTKDVSRPKEAPPRDRRITEDEIKAICAALGWSRDAKGMTPTTKQHRIAIAFLWAIETAMRAGEICSLAKGDVVGRVARLRMTKNGLPRDVPLSKRAIELWAMVPDGFSLATATLDALFRKARIRAGVTGMTFHDTRHEAITRLAAKVHVLDLARIVGHQDLKMLQRYYNASAEDIADRL